jgi:NAD(P)-dependent dehydrogenase (short-subunit alcohol dehydrogenase family)
MRSIITIAEWRPMRFAERVAVITAGGNGIGAATARLMTSEGAKVVPVDVDGASLAALRNTIETEGGTCVPIEADILDAAAVERLVETVMERFGRIDVLVNAVGGSTGIADSGVSVEEMTLDDWDRVLTLNLRGTFLCTRAVIPHMKRQLAGTVINLSSIVARGDNPRTNAAYTLAKAGISAMTRKLAVELGPYGITCNATAPGVTVTERIQKNILARRSEAEREAMIAAVPLRRLATPEDQARVIAFLASDDARFISGQTIEVTGGQ